jgi:hypothetical protein
MSSIKCGNCGLINFKSEAACKRCKAPFGESSPDSSARAWPAAGAAPSSQHARANEQASDDDGVVRGIWKDRKKVVKHVGAPLPSRCLKCNSTDRVGWKVYTLKYYPAYNLVLILFGFTRYLQVDVEVGLCAEHRARRTKRILCGVVALLASVGMFFLGLEWNMTEMWAGSSIPFIISCFFLACFNTPVSVSKIKEPYVWLAGADEQYLDSLPQWSGGGYTPLY